MLNVKRCWFNYPNALKKEGNDCLSLPLPGLKKMNYLIFLPL